MSKPFIRSFLSLAFLPTVASIAVLGGATSGASILAILRILHSRAGEVTRRVSRRISRRISSGELVNDWFSTLRRRRSDLLKCVSLFCSLKMLYSLRRALQGFDRSIHMNSWEQEVDADFEERLATYALPAFGEGVPVSPFAGIWRPYLLSHMSADENLHEMHAILGLVDRGPDEMTIDQMTEGVRRILLFKYNDLLTKTSKYWSMEQARIIAAALAKDCGMASPLSTGGLQECTPCDESPFSKVAFLQPKWLQALQRFSLDSMRPFFHAAWSWKSRFVTTPFGRMHVLDTHPSGLCSDQPPVILQHGAFVTSWSMALLGWLLSCQGRRVVMPDLFDYDHGYSKSDPALMGGLKVRRFHQHVEAVSCVVRDLLEELTAASMKPEVDLIGHSFGGILVAKLAPLCAEKGYPIRKVVMLAPGGPLIKINLPGASRFLTSPWTTVESYTPALVPSGPVKAAVKVALSIFFSPNNRNSLFGLQYPEYFGNTDGFGTDKPTLLLWGSADSVCHPRTELMPFLRQHFPSLDGFWVEGGDHNIQIDSAVSVARALEQWLGPCGSPASMSVAGRLLEKSLFGTDRQLTRMDIDQTLQTHSVVHQMERSKL